MMIITVAARASPLSRIQVDEVLKELQRYHPKASFSTTWLLSTGDLDQKTSLRTLGKTNFFTKEADDLVLQRQCQIGIHSAKDLADPLSEGLKIVAVTEGIDNSDVLVIADEHTLESLPRNATIATSSAQRENNVRQLRSDFTFVDIRGTIAQRLHKLECGEVHGVVVAKAALLRLGYDLNEIILPGTTTPLQGQLAIIAHEDDLELAAVFACIDSGNR